MSRQDDMLRTAKEVQLGNYAPAPFVLTHGRGRRVTDAAGREYLDLSGGISVLSVGHSHPTLAAAIGEQAARLMHVSNIFYNDRAIELAEAICARTPFDKVYFCNSGSEANEALLKLARRYHYDRGDTNRIGFVSTHNSFHGRTMGSLSVTGQTKYQKGMGPLLQDVQFIDFNDLAALDAAVTDDTAAVIFEPVQAEGGIIPATEAFVRGARRICDERGALLFFDEIQTGYGRTGRFLAQEWFGVAPDACSLAKGIGGGFPLGAMAVTDRVSQGLPPGSHASTFGGNPLACAAGLAVLHILDEEGLIENARRLGEYLASRLSELDARLETTAGTRGRGLLQGLILADDVDPSATIAAIHQAGLLLTLAGGHVIRVSPALNVTQEELDEGLTILERVLSNPPRK
ncbi:MAG TPA: acetylornithine/succinylornithine family transaminase [Polyangiales bacterium]|nr:acetylornithine/succinylornithine family transaminase [Polyangiales bacterium]